MPQMTIQQAFELAAGHHRSGRLREAEQLYRQILNLQPQHVDALHFLGAVAYQTERYDAAADLIRRAIALNPALPNAHSNLGLALIAAGKLDEAIAALRRAVILNPRSHEAHNKLGVALAYKAEFDEAIDAFRSAIALKPDWSEAHFNLGNAQRDKRQFDDAVSSFRQAIALRRNYAEAHSGLASVLKETGDLGGALTAHREAVALSPDDASIHSSLIFSMHYHPSFDAAAIAEECRRWNRRHAEPLGQFIQPHANSRDAKRPLRIGYVSADFCDHASAFFLLPLLRHHNRRQFEVFCYSLRADSTRLTREMKDQVHCWRTAVLLPDAKLAAQIRDDRIDILVDLKLHTPENRLKVFAHKPAPVQITWLGYPGTTGIDAMDYRLTDPYLDPRAIFDSNYSERSIHLPETFWCYHPLTSVPPVNELPSIRKGVVTFGCMNNFCKVNDGVLNLWARLLQAVPNSRLKMLAPIGVARRRTLERFERLGIASDRLEFVGRNPQLEYLQHYHEIDVGLDTFPYNGHTTTLDSLWMGVPVVTLVGRTAVGRAGISILSNAGLPELAALSEAQYLRIAGDLANDIPRLSAIRASLRERMQRSPLMDAPRFAGNVEAAYRQAWQRWCSPTANGAR